MKVKTLALLAVCTLLLLASHANAASKVDKAGKVIEIREKMFVAQTDDIYVNMKDYVGSTVRYEGIFATFPSFTPGEEGPRMVYRKSPGCCGFDGISGFQVAWDGSYPDPNAWVKVEGVLEPAGDGMLLVRLSSLEVMEKRGREFVTQ